MESGKFEIDHSTLCDSLRVERQRIAKRIPYQAHCSSSLGSPDTAEMRFSGLRSHWFWVSGYCIKWRIQVHFFTVRLHVRWISRLGQETQWLASILTYRFVQTICLHINWKRSSHSRRNFMSTFTEFTWAWRRSLTNGSDVKYVFLRRRFTIIFR